MEDLMNRLVRIEPYGIPIYGRVIDLGGERVEMKIAPGLFWNMPLIKEPQIVDESQGLTWRIWWGRFIGILHVFLVACNSRRMRFDV